MADFGAELIKASGTEPTTGRTRIIQGIHEEIHESRHFCYIEIFQLGLNVEKRFLLITPDIDRLCHLTLNAIMVAFDSAAEIEIFEGPTLTANGDLVTIQNSNYHTPKSNTTILRNGTITASSDGTLRFFDKVGSGQTVGGDISERNERILDKNKTYMIQVTSRAASNNMKIAIDWYESLLVNGTE